VNAIAAGCPVVIKVSHSFVIPVLTADSQPSELAPSSSALLAELIPRYLDPEGYAVVLGAVDQTTQLLEKQWGHSKLPSFSLS
jgi:aldehyde dehydrogenase (NAD+)